MSDEVKKEEILLSEEEVWDIIQFARSFGGYPSILTPDLISARMKDITLNPLAATQDTLEEALKDPKNSETELQSFSESFELQSQPYKRLISFLGNMLAWDLTYTCTNASYEDYKSKKYKKDLDIVFRFLDRLDYKKEFAIATREMLRNEAFFCSFRNDGNKIVLQELPTNPLYTKITGRWDYGLLCSFSMMWFVQAGVDINMYPPFFKKKYGELFTGENKNKYIPSIMPEMRDKSSWVYWVDLPPDVGWCFKMNPEIATRIPYFSPLFNDLVLQSLMRNLQRDINMSVASRIIIGQVGTLKDAGAKLKDQFNINPDLLGKFLSLVKSSISSAIKVAAAPLDNIQSLSFESENDMYPTFLKTALASSGVNTDLIFTSDVRPNILATQLSLNTDEQLMESIYPQFNAFLNYQINKETGYFKFKFNFEGTQFFNNRQQRFDKQMTLADKGIIMYQKIAAALGISPQDFVRQLEETRAMGFVDNLTPIVVNQFGSSIDVPKEGVKSNGRPKKSDSEISDEGAQTKESGQNIAKGGKA